MKKFIFPLAFVTTLLVSMSASANFYCVGNVNGVSLDANSGELLATNIGPVAWPRLCSVNVAANNISPAACKSIYATLLSAQLLNRPVTMYVTGNGSCGALVPWNMVTGFYFLTLN